MDKNQLKPNPKRHNISIRQLENDKWSFLMGCKSYVYTLDTWEKLVVQLSNFFMDQEKFFKDNNLESGNKKLKEPNLDVIIKHIKDNYNN